MKTIYLTLIASVFVLSCFAQKFSPILYSKKHHTMNTTWQQEMIKDLKVGDTIPDLSMTGIKNYKSSHTKLSEIKAKLIILDFWGVYCGSCINTIPEMENLQKEFDGNVQVIMITRDDQAAVDYEAAFHPTLKKTKLPMYNADAVFYKYLYYNGLPTHVWLDSNRVIRRIGSGEFSNKKTIENFLQNKQNNFANNILYKNFNHQMPAFVEGNGRNFDKVHYYSAVLKRIDGLGSTSRVDFPDNSPQSDDGGQNHLFIDNMPLWFIYDILLDGENHAFTGVKLNFIHCANRKVYEIRDSTLFFYKGREATEAEWNLNHTFCYELQVPEKMHNRIYEFMRTDLERFFGVTEKIEWRRVDCWVLKEDTGKIAPKSMSFIPDSVNVEGSKKTGYVKNKMEDGRCLYDITNNVFYLKNIASQYIITVLEDQCRGDNPTNFPIVVNGIADQSKLFNLVIKGTANNSSLYTKLMDFNALRKDLKRAGLMLERETRAIPMVIVKDVN